MTTTQAKTAEFIFKNNPKIEVLYMNERGEFFSNKSLAQNSVKADEKIMTIERKLKLNMQPKERVDTQKILNQSVADIKFTIQAINEIPFIEQLIIDEHKGQDRKGAKEALEIRLKELKENENGES
ncbi:hypothetical protein MSHRCOH1_05780 [Candidatus Ornithobacterium hominis]|uniref:hypothetical protein n=1 Tax=Candidatus Ornithobacterium hominis TaxID=2497989 RepID=UPI0024BC22A1|nr:hypothetical protein [Candidatus Ornithobacterium hominis]CAI9429703.1 hypothetical protein MSHRCOH1_05780 [Candidatus Ornithobacterium hominis]